MILEAKRDIHIPYTEAYWHKDLSSGCYQRSYTPGFVVYLYRAPSCTIWWWSHVTHAILCPLLRRSSSIPALWSNSNATDPQSLTCIYTRDKAAFGCILLLLILTHLYGRMKLCGTHASNIVVDGFARSGNNMAVVGIPLNKVLRMSCVIASQSVHTF